MAVVAFLILAVVLVGILALATWQVAPRFNRRWWNQSRPGSIWFHDPTGNIVPEDDEFKKPPNEGDLL